MLLLAVEMSGWAGLILGIAGAAGAAWTAYNQRKAKEAAAIAEGRASLASAKAEETKTAIAAWERTFQAQESHAETLRADFERLHQMWLKCEEDRAIGVDRHIKNLERITSLEGEVKVLKVKSGEG